MYTISTSKLNNPISLEHVVNRGELLKGIFSVKDSGIDSKIFHSWKIIDLLPTVPKNGWAKLSTVDLFWLDTLETMRKFGCSKKLMTEVCKKLFFDAYTLNLGKVTLEKNHAFLTKLSLERPLSYEEDLFLKNTKLVLNDSTYMSVLDRSINYFSQLVLSCFIDNIEVGLVIYLDGSFATYTLKNKEKNGNSQADLSVPHILIPISSFIKKFLVDEEKDKFLTKIGMLNESEMEVINLIRKKNVKKIIITLNDQNHTIKNIEAQAAGIIKKEDAEKIREVLGMKNYESIELHTRDSSTLTFTRTKKLK